MCPSLIQIGSKTAEKKTAQTNRQTNRHYENNGHLAVNQHCRQIFVKLAVKQLCVDTATSTTFLNNVIPHSVVISCQSNVRRA